MKILLVLVSAATVVTYACGHALYGEAKNLCPPPEDVSPCTCFKDPIYKKWTALCSNFSNAEDIKDIFDRIPGWKLETVHIQDSVMAYLPADMMERARFQTLTVSSTTLITLFDVTPVQTPELNLYLHNVKVTRNIQWTDIANSNLFKLEIFNMPIKTFGLSFKENIPRVVKSLRFENTSTRSITHQAFADLENLEKFVLMGGSLRTISRDMFPRPWKVNLWDMSFQKITVLPEDIFADEPNLSYFFMEGNFLKTISENVFTKNRVFYVFNGNPINCNCEIKWITTPGKIRLSTLDGTCTEPESFNGRQLSGLTEADFSYCN